MLDFVDNASNQPYPLPVPPVPSFYLLALSFTFEFLLRYSYGFIGNVFLCVSDFRRHCLIAIVVGHWSWSVYKPPAAIETWVAIV